MRFVKYFAGFAMVGLIVVAAVGCSDDDEPEIEINETQVQALETVIAGNQLSEDKYDQVEQGMARDDVLVIVGQGGLADGFIGLNDAPAGVDSCLFFLNASNGANAYAFCFDDANVLVHKADFEIENPLDENDKPIEATPIPAE
jgi:hypothetical protein